MTQLHRATGTGSIGRRTGARCAVYGRVRRACTGWLGTLPRWAGLGFGHDLPGARVVLALCECRELRAEDDGLSSLMRPVMRRWSSTQYATGSLRSVAGSSPLTCRRSSQPMLQTKRKPFSRCTSPEDLEKADPRLAQVAQCVLRGLQRAGNCETLEVTERTVQRDWTRHG